MAMKYIDNIDLENKIEKFMEQKSQEDKNWKLWIDFLTKDCYTLFVGSKWDLRIAALKVMAPVFAAFDRDVYQRIIFR